MNLLQTETNAQGLPARGTLIVYISYCFEIAKSLYSKDMYITGLSYTKYQK